MSLVGRDISTGFFKTLKAAILIIIEDEIENELSACDIWHAQFREEWYTYFMSFRIMPKAKMVVIWSAGNFLREGYESDDPVLVRTIV